MRLVYISTGKVPSTAANCLQMFKMCDAFRANGHDMTMLAAWHDARVRSDEDRRALEARFAVAPGFASRIRYVPYLSVRGRLSGSYLLIVPLVARALRPDLVVTRNARVALGATRLGLKVVLESHSPPGGPQDRRATRALCYQPGLVHWVFINERLRQTVAEQFRIPWDRTSVIYSAVDIERFRPAKSAQEARRALGLPLDRKLVVHSGSLYRGRGGEALIDIAARMPDVDFLLVGGRAEDIERIRGAGPAPSNLRFVGHVPVSDVPTYLFAADVLVIPSSSNAQAVDGSVHADYSTPLKMFEYLAAGRPIVATWAPGVAEVLRHGEDAWIVDRDDVAALAAGLRRVLDDAVLSRRLASGAATSPANVTWRERAVRIVDGPTAAAAQNSKLRGING